MRGPPSAREFSLIVAIRVKTGDALLQHHPERKDIGLAGQRPNSERLFRRQIPACPPPFIRFRDTRHGRVAGKAQIDEHSPSCARQHQIVRCDVAMNNALRPKQTDRRGGVNTKPRDGVD